MTLINLILDAIQILITIIFGIVIALFWLGVMSWRFVSIVAIVTISAAMERTLSIQWQRRYLSVLRTLRLTGRSE